MIAIVISSFIFGWCLGAIFGLGKRGDDDDQN